MSQLLVCWRALTQAQQAVISIDETREKFVFALDRRASVVVLCVDGQLRVLCVCCVCVICVQKSPPAAKCCRPSEHSKPNLAATTTNNKQRECTWNNRRPQSSMLARSIVRSIVRSFAYSTGACVLIEMNLTDSRFECVCCEYQWACADQTSNQTRVQQREREKKVLK